MVCVFPWIIWFLWKNRNGVVFDGVAKEADRLVQKAREEAEFWFMARAKEEEWIIVSRPCETKEMVATSFGVA